MKKLISVLVALSLVVGVAFTAMADSKELDSKNDGTPTSATPWEVTTGDITISVDTSDTDVRYNVVVTWTAATFEYDRADSEWDPSTHTYSDKGEWTKDEVKGAVVVANHSNADVAVSVGAYTEDAGINVTASATGSTTLETAAADGRYGVYENAAKVTYDLTVGADDIPEGDGTFTISGIKVTIKPA